MANHCWVCPSRNKEEFYDPVKLAELLNSEFKNRYGFDITGQGDDGLECVIKVWNYIKGSPASGMVKQVLFSMWCYTDYFADENFEEYIKNLDSQSEDLGDQFIKYKEQGDMDLSKCIEIRHTGNWKDEELVTNWMRQYFQALIFDEGIGEFIPPIPDNVSYVPKSAVSHYKNGIIKKFANFFKSK
jgi:hypothetical protein